MALGSGQLSLGDIAGEYGGSAPHALSEYYNKGNAPGSGEIQIHADFQGTSNIFTFNISSGTNTNFRTLAVAAGWDESAIPYGTLTSSQTISSGSTGTAAFTINGSLPTGTKFINNGIIVGRGGNGGSSSGAACDCTAAGGTNNTGIGAGGLALLISTAVIIDNGSGRVAGGGGGGGSGGRCWGNGSAISGFGSGGGGGGGIGGSSGGSSNCGSAGGSGSLTAAGSGGAGHVPGGWSCPGGLYTGAGGAGGGYGASGSTGSAGAPTAPGYAGGSGGAATSGNSNVTWSANGTINGSQG